MTRAKISEYSATANDNTDVNGINIAEGCPPSSMNNMGREIMAALKRFQVGSDGDGVTVGGSLVVSGSTSVNTFNVDVISEKTSAAGVTVDGVLLKDSQVSTDQINEKTSATGVTIDGVLLKDSGVVTGAGTVSAPVYSTTGDLNTGIFFPAADTIAFAEGGAEAMRITSDGRLGVGTTSPAVKFQVLSGTANTEVARFSGDGTDRGLSISMVSVGGISNAGVDFNSLGGLGTPGTLIFSGGGTERARIDSSGRLLINLTSSISTQAVLQVQQNCLTGVMAEFNDTDTTASNNIIRFRKNGTETGKITATTSNTTQYLTSSDYRLKENIAPMTGALATVAQLKPCTYTWKADGSAGQGFIAHELQAVVPDCVSGEKDAVDVDGNPQYQGVDTSFLVATLTAAIKEQQTIIESLQARIEALENNNV